MLAELVQAGQLPSVEERLPLDPKVYNEMPPSLLDFEVGQYGGTLRMLTSSVDWDADVFVFNNEPLVNSPAIRGEEFTGNIVQAYEVDPDYREYTFYMRPGLKWSDGEPVTVEDIRFTFEDVLFDEELTPTLPSWLKAGNDPAGDPVDFQVVDDFVFRLTFAATYGGFPVLLGISGWRGYEAVLKPAHFLKQFHKKYTPEDELNPLIEAEKLESWVQLFNQKDITNFELCRQEGIGFPSLHPWLLKEVQGQTWIYERNPYYHKIDPAGNQLPYIDRIESRQVQDIQAISLQIMAGDCDFAREKPAPRDFPLYKQNEENGGYRVIPVQQTTSTDVCLNLSLDDPVWREVVLNKKFREALNLAIDRNEVIDAVHLGLAEMPTIVPTEYDVDKANLLLDEIGMDGRDADGFRLGPDGKTFSILIETPDLYADQIPTCELFVQFWLDIGIKTSMKKIDSALYSQRVGANEIQAACMWVHTNFWYYLDFGQSLWCPLWNRWFTTGGKEGEEPPDDVKAFLTKLYSLLQVPPAEATAALAEMKQMLYDNIYFFIPADPLMMPLIANAKLGNVSESPENWGIATNFTAEGFFFKD